MGGLDGTEAGMAAIRDHLAARGLGLHNDLQTEASIVGNLVFHRSSNGSGPTSRSASSWTGRSPATSARLDLTEPAHGSDATWLETRAVRDGGDWVINGAKRFASGAGLVQHAIVFARTSGEPGQALGITAFIVPTSDPAHRIRTSAGRSNMPDRSRRGRARRPSRAV